MSFKIYTDGSCTNNGYFPNEGGFGVVVVNENDELVTTHSERENNTTNNRQEMKAILYALRNYGKDNPDVYTDSHYSLMTFTVWMYGWQKRGWLKADNTTPENLDLVKEFLDLWEQGNRINLIKVKGHSGNRWNELADSLATNKGEK